MPMTDRPRRPGLPWASRFWWPRSLVLSTKRSRRRTLGFGWIGAQRLLKHRRTLGPRLVMVAWRELVVSRVGDHPLAELLRSGIVAGPNRDLQSRASVRAIGNSGVRPGVGYEHPDDGRPAAERRPRERGLPVLVDGVDLDVRAREQQLHERPVSGKRRDDQWGAADVVLDVHVDTGMVQQQLDCAPVAALGAGVDVYGRGCQQRGHHCGESLTHRDHQDRPPIVRVARVYVGSLSEL